MTTYDDDGRFVSERSVPSGSAANLLPGRSTCTYQQHAIACTKVELSGTSACRYGVDDTGRIVSTRCQSSGKSQGKQKTVEYDIRGQELRSGEKRLYDAQGRLAEIQMASISTTLLSALGVATGDTKSREIRRYTYDDRGRRTHELIWQNGRIVETERFAWDSQDHLVASVDSSGSRRQVTTYSYDSVGRLISTSSLEVDGAIPSLLLFEGRTTYSYECWGDRDPGLLDCHHAGDGVPCPNP